MTRKNRGVVGSIYKPVGTLARGASATLNTAVRGANRTLSSAASTLNRTARNILRPFGLSRRNRK